VRNVAIRAVQIARARHQETYAVFSEVAHSFAEILKKGGIGGHARALS
jgi:hypothetical protein